MKKKKFSGCQIFVLSPDFFGFTGGIQIFSKLLVKAMTEIIPAGQIHVFIKSDGSDNARQRDLPGPVYHVTEHIPIFCRTLFFVIQIMTAAFRLRPNIIITTHAHFSPVCAILKKMIRIPFWIVAHGVEVWSLKDGNIIRALRYADRILCVSHYTRNRILDEQSLRPESTCILFDTYDSDRFKPDRKPERLLKHFKLNELQPVILTVSRLSQCESYKGYELLLKAMPMILRAFPEAYYLIVGSGDYYPMLERMIKSMDLEKSAGLAGFVPDRELPDYYNLCDVFVLPSKLEGFGIVYLEAMASGKPVVGGNADGAVDALWHGELGALVDPDDIEDIAGTVIKILKRNYPLPIMYQPRLLSDRVQQLFGYRRFKERVTELIMSIS